MLQAICYSKANGIQKPTNSKEIGELLKNPRNV